MPSSRHRPRARRAPGALALLLAALGAVQGSPGATPAPFRAPLVLTGDDLFEPGVRIARDGTIYVHAILGIPVPSTIFRSTNGGSSFARAAVGIRDFLPGGGDADVATLPDGTLVLSDLWLGSSTVSISSDRGATWTAANPVGGVPAHDRQWLAASSAAVYHVYNQFGVGLVVSKSLDGGLTFPISSVAATHAQRNLCVCPPGLMIAEAGTMPAGTDDRVGVIYFTASGGIGFARSLNGGLTFGTVAVAPGDRGFSTTMSFPVVANARGRRLVAVWLESDGARTWVAFSRSTNWGETWSHRRRIVIAGTSLFPWVDARGSKVAISLYHTTAASVPGGVPEGAQWFVRYLESADRGTTWTSLATIDTKRVKAGPICAEGLECGADRELGDFQAVALDARGRAHVAWTRSIDNVSDTQIRYARQR